MSILPVFRYSRAGGGPGGRGGSNNDGHDVLPGQMEAKSIIGIFRFRNEPISLSYRLAGSLTGLAP